MLHVRTRGAPSLFAFHVPSGGYRRPVEAAIFKGLGAIAGVPDVILVKDGTVFALELKSENGKLSDAQRECHERLRKAGAVVHTAYGLDEAIAWLEQHALLRGRVS